MDSLFSADASRRSSEPVRLPKRTKSVREDPSLYVIEDEGLVAAVNAALLLGNPLLLTGEAGCGKTTLAERIAWQLHLDPPLRFETKSTSVSKDLFYTYDALGRFHDVQRKKSGDGALPYFTFAALGRAIVGTLPAAQAKPLAPPHQKEVFAKGPRRSVVLIDEIDKANRDFPNDVLNEIDAMFFRIPELGNREVRADESLRPVVVITSNSERNLPEPFLRRCVYYHMKFPADQTLRRILSNLLPEFAAIASGKLADSSLAYFAKLRSEAMQKRPATAEIANWIAILLACGAAPDLGLDRQKDVFQLSLPALAKTQEDAETALRVARQAFGWT